MLRRYCSPLILLFLVTISFAANIPFHTLPDTFHLDPETYGYADTVEIGQGRVGEVNGELWDVTIPLNRVTWAIAIAHGHQLMRNLLRTEIYPNGIFLATALKESSLGCDPAIVQDATLQFPIRQIWDTGDGFYQIEGWESSAYGEMAKLYPIRFPLGKHSELIGNDHFETATLAKVYYDLMVLLYWKYQKQYRPLELFDNSADKQGTLKMISAAYYMGHQGVDAFYGYVFNTNRANSYTQDYMDFFYEEPFVSDAFYKSATTHAELVSQMVSVFQDSASKPGIPATNYFTEFYDTTVTLDDCHHYIQKIAPLYPEADTTLLKQGVDSVFATLTTGSSIRFQQDIGTIVDYLILHLPADNPVPSIQTNYPFVWNDSLDYEPKFDEAITPITSSNEMSERKHFTLSLHRNQLQFTPTKSQLIQLNLYDARGRIVLSRSHNVLAGQQHTFSLSSALSTGVYFVEIAGELENFKSQIVVR